MIAVLLLAAGLVFGGLGLGVYLLVRPDPPEDEANRPPVESSRSTPRPTSRTAPRGPGSGTGSATTAIERPGASENAPREVAEDYVAAVNARDETGATALTCQEADPGTLFSVTEDREVTLDEVEVLEGSVASATVRVGDSETAFLLENRENGWCVAI
jgi:hypothetical protein